MTTPIRMMKTQHNPSKISVNARGGLLEVDEDGSTVGSPNVDVGMGVGVAIC